MTYAKFFAGAASALALASVAVPASAAVSIEGTVSTSGLTGDPGLVSYANALGFGPLALNNIGDSAVAKVLRIGTKEGSVELDDIIFTDNLLVNFSFLSPSSASGPALGGTVGGTYTLAGKCSLLKLTGGGNGGCGYATFGPAQNFTFGNGGLFSVQLSNVLFDTPGYADVEATFTLLGNSVPEPGTWAMMILGFGLIGGAMRRRQRQTVQYSFA